MATNNAINTPIITLGGTFTMVGLFTFTGTLTANTAVTFPTSGTLLSTSSYPAPGATLGKIVISDGTNWIASTSIWPNTVGTALHILLSNGTTNVYSTPAYPNASATLGKVIISNGTDYVASTSIWPNTVGAALHLVLSDGTSNVYSTPAYPNASVTAGKIIISDGTDYIASTSIFPNTVGAAGKLIRSDGTINTYTTAEYPDIAGTAGNVLTSDGTDFVSAALPAPSVTPQNIQNETFVYAVTTGIADNYVATFTPPFTAYADGQKITLKIHAPNTGNAGVDVDGLGNVIFFNNDGTTLSAGALLLDGQYDFVYNSTFGGYVLQNSSLQLDSVTPEDIQNQAFTAAADTGVADAYVFTLTPPLTAYTAYQRFSGIPGSSSTGAFTVDVDGLGVLSVLLNDGSTPYANAMLSGGVYDFEYSPTYNTWILLNPEITPLLVTAQNIQNQSFIYAVDSGVADAYVATFTPPFTAYADGQKISVRFTNSNTAASTIDVDGLGAQPIYLSDFTTLPAGAILVGSTYDLDYSSTFSGYVLMNPTWAYPGANGNITSMTGLTGAIKAPVSIQSAANENILQFSYAASAVNWILIGNNATGLQPVINAVGTDTDIDLNIGGKGTGAVNILGASTNSTAPTGYVGEYISSNVPFASGVSIAASNNVVDVTSISLGAGDWDTYGNVGIFNTTNQMTVASSWSSSTSATQPDASLISSYFNSVQGITIMNHPIPFMRFSLSATTTIYLSATAAFSGGTTTAYGSIFARRVR